MTPFLKVKNVYLRSFFRNILPLCRVTIQDRVMMARVRYIIPQTANYIVDDEGPYFNYVSTKGYLVG